MQELRKKQPSGFYWGGQIYKFPSKNKWEIIYTFISKHRSLYKIKTVTDMKETLEKFRFLFWIKQEALGAELKGEYFVIVSHLHTLRGCLPEGCVVCAAAGSTLSPIQSRVCSSWPSPNLQTAPAMGRIMVSSKWGWRNHRIFSFNKHCSAPPSPNYSPL